MIQFAVNSTAYLLKNVPIDRGYEHSYRFTSPTEQNEWMLGANHAPVRFNNLTYIREHNSILLEGSPEDYMDYNYIAYVNESYDPSTVYSSDDMRYTESANTRRRWIYGFISSVRYYSNNVVEIFFAVDVLQTFYFDFEFGKCFVEREHSASDEIGENIVPEPVSYETFCCVKEETVGTKEIYTNDTHHAKWLGGLVLARGIKGQKDIAYGNADITHIYGGDTALAAMSAPTPDFGQSRKTTGIFTDTKPLAGVPTSLYWYMDIPVEINNDDDVMDTGNPNVYPTLSVGTIINRATVYAFNNYLYQAITGEATRCFSLSDLVHWICTGALPAVTTMASAANERLNENDIVAVFIYPAEFTALGASYSTPYERGVRKKDESFISLNKFKSTISGSDYTPVNSKLLTSPFRYIEVSSNIGGVNQLKFEHYPASVYQGKKVINPRFSYFMCASANPTAILVPRDYAGKEYDFDNGVIIGDMPQPSYQGDKLAEYLTQNRNKLTSTVIQTAANLIGSMFGAHTVTTYSGEHAVDTVSARDSATGRMRMTDKHETVIDPRTTTTKSEGGAGGIVGSFNAICGMIGHIQDLRATPPTVYGNAAITDMRCGVNRYGVTVREMGISAELAKIVDQFFTMFGYATNAVKKPGIYNRYRYQYIKLGQAVIHPNSYAITSGRTGMNAEVEERLSAIFSKGITMWNKDFDIGDYPDGEANPVCTGVVVAIKQSSSNEVRDHFDVTIGYGGRTITLPGSDAAITVDRQYMNPGTTPTVVNISINGYTFEQTFN